MLNFCKILQIKQAVLQRLFAQTGDNLVGRWRGIIHALVTYIMTSKSRWGWWKEIRSDLLGSIVTSSTMWWKCCVFSCFTCDIRAGVLPLGLLNIPSGAKGKVFTQNDSGAHKRHIALVATGIDSFVLQENKTKLPSDQKSKIQWYKKNSRKSLNFIS